MYLDRDFVGQLTPLQCRHGPIKSQQCTDFYCCAVYLLLVALVLFFNLLSVGGIKMTAEEVEMKVNQNHFGAPLHSIVETVVPIVVSLALIAAICIISVITSFIVPVFITILYIPLLVILMLAGGTIFLLRYLAITIPFISPKLQQNFAHQSSNITLIMSICFFIGFFISLITLCRKRSKIQFIYPVLRIAKTAFWPNFYIFIFPFLFSLLTIAMIVSNVALLSISLTRKTHIIHKSAGAILILIQVVFTHGVIVAISDFFFQSIGIHWYFKKRRLSLKEEKVCDTLFLTFQMMAKHIGTIVNGFILAYIPDTVNTVIGSIQGKSALIYHIFFFWHKLTIKYYSKYCFFQTIMQSLSFSVANKQMYGVRQRSKKIIPQTYMMGSFFVTLAKMCSVILGLIACYFLIVNSSQLKDVYKDIGRLIGPLGVVLFGGLQISNHFMNMTGILGDTIVFTYFVDIQIQKKDFGDAEPYSCPNQIRDIIYEVKAGQSYIPD